MRVRRASHGGARPLNCGVRPHMRTSRRAALIVLLGTFVGGCSRDEQPTGATPYEAFLAHVGGLEREYVVRSRPADPDEFASDALVGYAFPSSGASHDAASFGGATVRFVGNIQYGAMFSRGCDAGWTQFHSDYQEAGALLDLSQPGRSELGRRVAIYVEFGVGCLGSRGEVFYLEEDRGRWRVVEVKNVWVS